jgi:hypothetical protein
MWDEAQKVDGRVESSVSRCEKRNGSDGGEGGHQSRKFFRTLSAMPLLNDLFLAVESRRSARRSCNCA